jgi:hypothetical protein
MYFFFSLIPATFAVVLGYFISLFVHQGPGSGEDVRALTGSLGVHLRGGRPTGGCLCNICGPPVDKLNDAIDARGGEFLRAQALSISAVVSSKTMRQLP